MEQWEYAAGYQNTSDEWRVFDVPGTFEHASQKLRALEWESREEGWATNPCIVKRSEVHPQWTPVHDHAAELLAEAVQDMAYQFGNFGAGIIQGYDLVKTLRKVAQGISRTLPQNTEEYDS